MLENTTAVRAMEKEMVYCMFEARDMTLQVERLTTSARLARRSATESQAFADETLSRFDTAQTQLHTAHTELRIARDQIFQARIQLGAAHIKLDAAHSQLDAASEQKVTLVSLPRRGLRMRFWKRKWQSSRCIIRIHSPGPRGAESMIRIATRRAGVGNTN